MIMMKKKYYFIKINKFIDENHMYFQKSYLNRKLFTFDVNFYYIMNKYIIAHKVHKIMDEYYIERENILLYFPILFQEYCDNGNSNNINILLQFYSDLKKKRNYELVSTLAENPNLRGTNYPLLLRALKSIKNSESVQTHKKSKDT